MYPIKEAHIIRMVERIGEHYRANIASPFLRQALLQLPLDKTTWDNIEELTKKMDEVKYQGLHMDELYQQIASCAHFAFVARRDLASSLKNRVNLYGAGETKVLRDMAVNTFTPNLKVFTGLLYELYQNLIELDTIIAKGRKPLHKQMPELADVVSLLSPEEGTG